MKPTTLSRLHTEFVLSARGRQRGPDEETEMNFMSAGQCPAVHATRTAMVSTPQGVLPSSNALRR